MVDLREEHRLQLDDLAKGLKGNTQRIHLKKKTVSNLFRYQGREKRDEKALDLSNFDRPLFLDIKNQTLEIQGLATYESAVDFLLPYGFLPEITPGLKHITVAGAIAGVAIESNCARYGFAHDGLIEADVILPDGRIVTCNAKNKHKDLFHALPNSYGTLGYILRAKIKLRPAKPYVLLETTSQPNIKTLLRVMKATAEDGGIDYVESLAYSKNRLFLTAGRQIDSALQKPLSIYGKTVFYKEISKPGAIVLTTKEYLFRYDPEWFWALPASKWLGVFRRVAPQTIRNSGFYTHFMFSNLGKVLKLAPKPDFELLIQDWEVPWNEAEALFNYGLEAIDLAGAPWLSGPIKSPGTATLYPVTKGKLYLNLGCYASARKKASNEPFMNTKLMDDFCIKHSGIKMLYSSSFMNRQTFDHLYDGAAYKKLKQKYDSRGLAPTVFEKAVR